MERQATPARWRNWPTLGGERFTHSRGAVNFEALHPPFARIVSVATADQLQALHARDGDHERDLVAHLKRLRHDARLVAQGTEALAGGSGATTPVDDFVADLESGISWGIRLARDTDARRLPRLARSVWLALVGWLAVRGLGGPPGVPDRNRRCRERMHDWRLDQVTADAFRQAGRDHIAAVRAAEAVAAIQELPMWTPDGRASDASTVIASWLADPGVREVLDMRRDGAVERYDEEAYRELVAWTTWVAAIRLAEYPTAYHRPSQPMIDWVTALSEALSRAGSEARGRTDRLGQASG